MAFAYLDIVLALTAIFGLCVFFTLRAGLHAALAPLCTLSVYTTVLTLTGVAGVLYPAALALYGVSWALGGWALAAAVRARRAAPVPAPTAPAGEPRCLMARLLPPGALVFWLLAISFALYFAWRQPMFSQYDEYSFWGTAAKLTSTQDVLYTEAEIGWPWQATQNCGLIVMSYFVQLFGQFAAWKVHLAFDLVLFACFAAVVGGMEWKHYSMAFPAAVACWLTPYVFSVAGQQIYVCPVYMLAYGDIQAGVMFGGAVAFWLALRQEKGPFWAILPVLTFTANIKANTFVLSLAAAGIIAVDLVLFAPGRPWKKGLPVRLAKAAGAFAGPVMIYLVWNVWYVQKLTAQNSASGGLGDTSQALTTVALNGIKMLLGLPVTDYYEARRERFHRSAAQIWAAFFDRPITMLGTGFVVVLLLGLMLLWVLVLMPGWREKLRLTVLWGLVTVCFGGYNLMLLLSYAFIFNESTGDGLVDYSRYLYAYYMGWFLLTLAMLCLAARLARWKLPGGLSLLALACSFLVGFHTYLAPELTVVGYNDGEFAEARICAQQVENVMQAIEADPGRTCAADTARIFLIDQGDSGEQWFQYSYEFLPAMLKYGNLTLGGGGGTYGTPELYDGTTYYHAYTAQAFWEYVSENCDYLFILDIDQTFLDSYSQLFIGQSRESTPRGMAVYRVTEGGFVWVSSIEVA